MEGQSSQERKYLLNTENYLASLKIRENSFPIYVTFNIYPPLLYAFIY